MRLSNRYGLRSSLHFVFLLIAIGVIFLLGRWALDLYFWVVSRTNPDWDLRYVF